MNCLLSLRNSVCFALISVLAVGMAGAASAQEVIQTEPVNVAPWYASVGLGMLQYEGDEPVEDGFILVGRLGYDYDEWWTFEGQLAIAPSLDANTVGFTDYEQDPPVKTRRRLADFDSTEAVSLAVDALFHFTRWERLDPFLAVGAGFIYYGDDVDGTQFDPAIRVGGGVMYHYNDEWAVRADARTFLAGNDTEANATLDAGVVWTWGAHVPPDYVAVGGPRDSDRDGLADDEETDLGTDPYDPDTDRDGLSDGEEVNTYRTDPLNPDTDWDALRDGEEVVSYNTDPLKQDTDNGGVSDGHEVLEDNTDPLNGDDDLILYTLNIEFDTDKAIIKPVYFPEIDIIGKVLNRNPEATAVIEGHADKRKSSDEKYNKKLSERRAEAVMAYLVTNGEVEARRLKAVGYGFSRPKAPNDPVHGNQHNRRVEVYIRGLDKDSLTAEERDLSSIPAPEDK